MRAADDFKAIRERMRELVKEQAASPVRRLPYTRAEAEAVANLLRCVQTSCAWRVSRLCEIANQCEHRQAAEQLRSQSGRVLVRDRSLKEG